jgi:hypothetical protein
MSSEDALQDMRSLFEEEDVATVDMGGEEAGGAFFTDPMHDAASLPSPLLPAHQGGMVRDLESLNDWGPMGFSMVEDRPYCYFDLGPTYCPKPGELEGWMV